MRKVLGWLWLAAIVASPLAGCGGTSTPIYAQTFATSTPRAAAIYVGTAAVPGSLLSVGGSSNGTITPSTLISGSNASLASNAYATVDLSGRLWTTNCQNLLGGSGPVVAFGAAATGNVTPAASIGGSNTGLAGCQSGIVTDSAGFIYVADVANNVQFPGGQIAVFAPTATGNVAPSRVIAGIAAGLHGLAGLAVDRQNNLYVVDSAAGYPGVLADVRVFAAGANGNATASRVIAGLDTALSLPQGIAVDAGGSIYVANAANASISVYAANAAGDAVPIRIIQGSSTQLDRPAGLALDSAGYLYVGSRDTTTNPAVLVFAPAANGNASPVQAFTVNVPGYTAPAGIAVR